MLKNKYERKIKKVRVSSAKQRTENALQVFELKDQLAAMKKEYASLELVLVKKEREVAASALKAREAGEEVASLRGSSATERSRKANAAAAATATPGNDSADEEDPVEVAHGNLVVQLSMQIADLDGELEEANTIIAQLRAAAGWGCGGSRWRCRRCCSRCRRGSRADHNTVAVCGLSTCRRRTDLTEIRPRRRTRG